MVVDLVVIDYVVILVLCYFWCVGGVVGVEISVNVVVGVVGEIQCFVVFVYFGDEIQYFGFMGYRVFWMDQWYDLVFGWCQIMQYVDFQNCMYVWCYGNCFGYFLRYVGFGEGFDGYNNFIVGFMQDVCDLFWIQEWVDWVCDFCDYVFKECIKCFICIGCNIGYCIVFFDVEVVEQICGLNGFVIEFGSGDGFGFVFGVRGDLIVDCVMIFMGFFGLQ